MGVLTLKLVTAAILAKDGRVLIARRGAGDSLAYKWEFPGGKIEGNESPEECLRRELSEEFKIEVEVGAYFGDSVYHYDQGAIRLLAYHTRWLSGELQPVVHDEFRWVAPENLEGFDFAPADIPLVQRLIGGTKKAEHT